MLLAQDHTIRMCPVVDRNSNLPDSSCCAVNYTNVQKMNQEFVFVTLYLVDASITSGFSMKSL